MTDAEPRSLAVQLKSLGQILGIRNRTLRYVVDNNLVPGVHTDGPGHFVPREFTEQESALIAAAAILHDHGFRGTAAAEIVRKAASQLAEGKLTILVDFRGDFPVKVQLSIGDLLKRLRSKKK